MTDGDSIAHVAVVVLLLALAVPALATAYDTAGTPFSYDESLTVDYTSDSSVDENATIEGYGDETTVVANGQELSEGTDYRWDDSNGAIEWIDTNNTTAGDTAQIEYRAYQRTEETEMSWMVIAPFMGLFGVFGFVAAARALWSYTAEVWDLV